MVSASWAAWRTAASDLLPIVDSLAPTMDQEDVHISNANAAPLLLLSGELVPCLLRPRQQWVAAHRSVTIASGQRMALGRTEGGQEGRKGSSSAHQEGGQ
eukprot:CAMPEP_0182887372 /NCGR_PEP_ID=MMETSP0034_2-20130328/20787_1 /TAXON_ID=156128 /ORGANISM="Nephroselmis pyriformis, Strain CCMP717" /LENGTH=99 /DNA_ID=CAMNT_0025020737 /DNA_START=305 /DNA_END=601 /DNA_ORIENTATION=-